MTNNDSAFRLIRRAALAVAVLAATPSASWPQACLTSALAWQNVPIAAQSAPFQASFDAVPGAAKMDGVTSLSLGAASGYAGLAAIVRFNNAGFIDARNGGAYAAAAAVPYIAGSKYHVRLAVNPAARTYSVYVTPPGGAETTLGTNYAFRTEQAAVSSLNNWALEADAGTHQVCAFALSGGAPPDTTPPAVRIAAPASGASLAGTAAVSGTASDNIGVLSVAVSVDGGAFAQASGASAWSYSLNTTGLANGAHTITVQAKDAAGNAGTASVSVAVNNAPPPAPGCLTASTAWQNTAFAAQTAAFTAAFDAVPGAAAMDGVTGFSLGSASAFTSMAAVVRFNNAGAIDARNGGAYAAAAAVPYAVGSKYHFRLAVNPAAHTYSVYVTPPGAAELTLATNYAFRTEQGAAASLNNWTLFADAGSHQVCGFSLSPAAPPQPDTAPPAVSVTAPLNSAVVSGQVSVSGTAADNVGVAGVQFLLDGANLGAESIRAPYSAAWNTTSSADGSHALTAVARDAAGNKTTSAAVQVTVRNAPSPDTTPPAVSVTAPLNGAVVSGQVSVSGTAADNVGVAGVQFLLDGANLGAEDLTAPYSAAWNTTSSADGAHALTAVARDAAGNKTTSAAVQVTVRNTQPVGGRDRFGVTQLYPALTGGKEWVSSWDNGSARTFSGIDPKDAWFDAAHGDATYNVDGKGLFVITGAVPRMYIHDPAHLQSWRNVEMTVYAMRVSDGSTAYAGVNGVARSNHGTTGSETANLCDTRGYGARMRFDGTVDFDKETSHPNAVAAASKPMFSGGMPKNKWLGYKHIVYDMPDGNVLQELWIDQTDGLNGGAWVKVNSFIDTGSNFGGGGVACKAGIDPALKLTNSDARPGSESGKPNITVYWRSDNINANGHIYKKMSVREIAP